MPIYIRDAISTHKDCTLVTKTKHSVNGNGRYHSGFHTTMNSSVEAAFYLKIHPFLLTYILNKNRICGDNAANMLNSCTELLSCLWLSFLRPQMPPKLVWCIYKAPINSAASNSEKKTQTQPYEIPTYLKSNLPASSLVQVPLNPMELAQKNGMVDHALKETLLSFWDFTLYHGTWSWNMAVAKRRKKVKACVFFPTLIPQKFVFCTEKKESLWKWKQFLTFIWKGRTSSVR